MAPTVGHKHASRAAPRFCLPVKATKSTSRTTSCRVQSTNLNELSDVGKDTAEEAASPTYLHGRKADLFRPDREGDVELAAVVRLPGKAASSEGTSPISGGLRVKRTRCYNTTTRRLLVGNYSVSPCFNGMCGRVEGWYWWYWWWWCSGSCRPPGRSLGGHHPPGLG